MILAIQDKIGMDEDKDYFESEVYQNIASIRYEYQAHNGEKGSYWLELIFRKDSPEAKEYKNGRCYIEIDPKNVDFQIYRDSK